MSPPGAQPQLRLHALAKAVPRYRLSQSDVIAKAAEHFGVSLDGRARLAAVYANAQIDTRYSCVPIDWYTEPHSFAERNRLYVENALDLLEKVAREAAAKAGLGIADIEGLVIASSAGIATPSLDALLMERLDMRRTTMRLPIFGLGCAGGVIGLARTAALARAEPGRPFLFLVVEICGLTFRLDDLSKGNAIAAALFGDGAAGAVVDCGGEGTAITAWGEHTWRESLDVMGWRVLDDGFGVMFARDIPRLMRERLRAATEDFLGLHGVGLGDIDSFVCHPGGAKVVEALEETFELGPGGLEHSRAVLRDYGNMSAPTALFVLDASLAAGASGRHLMSALGPGFTCGLMLLEND